MAKLVHARQKQVAMHGWVPMQGSGCDGEMVGYAALHLGLAVSKKCNAIGRLVDAREIQEVHASCRAPAVKTISDINTTKQTGCRNPKADIQKGHT